MKYMLLIYGDESLTANATPAEMQREMDEYNAFTAMTRDRGVYLEGEALHSIKQSKTVRVRDGKSVVTDGPFVETRETLGGYYLIDAKDLDEAIEIAAQIPGARTGGIEIRPLVVWE